MSYGENYHHYKCLQRNEETGAQNCSFDLFVPAWYPKLQCPYHGVVLMALDDGENGGRIHLKSNIPEGSRVLKTSIVGW